MKKTKYLTRKKSQALTAEQRRQNSYVNRRTSLLDQVIDIIEEDEFSPVREAVYLYHKALQEFEDGKAIPPCEECAFCLEGEKNRCAVARKEKAYRADYLKIAAQTLENLMSYVYPKRKAIDLTSKGQSLGETLIDVIKAGKKETKK